MSRDPSSHDPMNPDAQSHDADTPGAEQAVLDALRLQSAPTRFRQRTIAAFEAAWAARRMRQALLSLVAVSVLSSAMVALLVGSGAIQPVALWLQGSLLTARLAVVASVTMHAIAAAPVVSTTMLSCLVLAAVLAAFALERSVRQGARP